MHRRQRDNNVREISSACRLPGPSAGDGGDSHALLPADKSHTTCSYTQSARPALLSPRVVSRRTHAPRRAPTGPGVAAAASGYRRLLFTHACSPAAAPLLSAHLTAHTVSSRDRTPHKFFIHSPGERERRRAAAAARGEEGPAYLHRYLPETSVDASPP